MDDSNAGSSSTTVVPSTESNGSAARQKHLDRFQALKKRREDATRGSESRRINDIKISLVANIREQFKGEHELAALKHHSVDLDQLTAATEAEQNRRKRKHQRSSSSANISTELPSSSSTEDSDSKKFASDECVSLIESTRTIVDSNLRRMATETVPIKSPAAVNTPAQCTAAPLWQEIRPYLTVNNHLITTTGSGRTVQSRLEERIEEAIAASDYETAERLNDELATRDFGVKIAAAIDAKTFIDRRKKEEEAAKAARKKKLAWGFVPKHRWETKGNM